MNADHRLTAYALGELAPAEREAFERDLAASSELQAELTAITQLSDHLMKTLIDPEDTLTSEQRDDLRARVAAAKSTPRTPRRLPIFLGALAAGLAVLFGLWASIRPSTKTPTVPPLVISASVSNADPLPATPALTSAENAKVQQQLLEGQRFFDRGSFDLAVKRSTQVLALDQSNLPARQLLEKADAARQTFDKEVYNATRSKTLMQATKGWELPTRHGGRAKSEVAAVDSETPAAETPPVAASKPAESMTAPHVTAMAGPPAAIQPARELQPLTGADTSLSGPVTASAVAGVPMGRTEVTLAQAKESRRDEALTKTAPSQPPGNVVDTLSIDAAGASITTRLRPGPLLAGGWKAPSVATAPTNEAYAGTTPNIFQSAAEIPLSTFSIDVDTASYSNVRRFLNDGQLPPADAVRIEELINYFPSALPQPADDAPFSITTEVSRAPWNPDRLLARIALKGRDLAADKLPPSNLVFLVDVSGSMRPENKLPLLQRSLRELVQRLTPRDRVAIAVYAGSSGLALPSTSGEDQARILDAIDRLESGGSTNGASGIQLAYDTARKNFFEEGNNRVILCTDGDFNVGVTSQEELTRLIERERKSGVFLSVLGFGTGNLKDATMENLADKGNGNYAYIDSPSEGRKVLVEQMGATLFTIAKDVKIQVEFNPATVAGYRLIGYENRRLAKEDFNDDTKDAGEIGAGHTVTALYEIVPAGQPLPNNRTVDALKYQAPPAPPLNPQLSTLNSSKDLFTVKLRFKAPDSDSSKLIEKVVAPEAGAFDRASDDFRFASAVAAFGMKLRAGPADATMDWSAIQRIARGSLGEDPGTYRAEFLTLIEKARQLTSERD